MIYAISSIRVCCYLVIRFSIQSKLMLKFWLKCSSPNFYPPKSIYTLFNSSVMQDRQNVAYAA